MKKLLLLIISSLFIISCAGTAVNQGDVAGADTATSAEEKASDEAVETGGTKKTKPCNLSSRLKRC